MSCQDLFKQFLSSDKNDTFKQSISLNNYFEILYKCKYNDMQFQHTCTTNSTEKQMDDCNTYWNILEYAKIHDMKYSKIIIDKHNLKLIKMKIEHNIDINNEK